MWRKVHLTWTALLMLALLGAGHAVPLRAVVNAGASATRFNGAGSLDDGLRMVSPTEGWAIGGWTLDGGLGSVIQRTTDAGRTFVDVSPPGLTRPVETSRVQRFVLDAENAWILMGATVYRTRNGGVTWAASELPPPIPALTTDAQLHFVDPMHGWVVRLTGLLMFVPPGTLVPIVVQTGFQVFRTQDGGASWLPVSANPLPLATYCHASTVRFASPELGYLGIGCLGIAMVEITRDGGVTWAPSLVPVPHSALGLAAIEPSRQTPFLSVEVGFASGSQAALLVEDFTGRPQFHAVIDRSSDAGLTWARGSEVIDESAPSYGDRATFGDADHAWLPYACTGACEEGPVALLRTTDGGATWTKLRIKPGTWPFSDPTASVSEQWRLWELVNPDLGFVYCQDGPLYRTTDGGMTFVKVSQHP